MTRGNKAGHRRFGNVRKLPSGRYQASYLGPDGRRRNADETFERKADADRALSLLEAQIAMGDWTDPKRAKARLGDYAAAWIEQRSGLRPRTADLYRWLLGRQVAPHLGSVELGKLTPALVRQWRAHLIADGVSVSVTAKAYRLLRAVLMTAVDDNILVRNPCRIRGGGAEHTAERPVLTVSQVFEVADLVGRRPVGNIRKLADGTYRVRFMRDGSMQRCPLSFESRSAADAWLWQQSLDGTGDCRYDARYRALVLLATFCSLRYGEVTALRRRDIDLAARTVRVLYAYAERSDGQVQLGPPKSAAGSRTVGIPTAIVPDIQAHLATFTEPGQDAVVFTTVTGQPVRRSNFNKMTGWPRVVAFLGLPGVHVHDLRGTGNDFAAADGAGIKDLMARMGHASEKAALIYQHRHQDADQKITGTIDGQIEAARLSRHSPPAAREAG